MNAFAEYMKEVCLKLDRKVADLDDVREDLTTYREPLVQAAITQFMAPGGGV